MRRKFSHSPSTTTPGDFNAASAEPAPAADTHTQLLVGENGNKTAPPREDPRRIEFQESAKTRYVEYLNQISQSCISGWEVLR